VQYIPISFVEFFLLFYRVTRYRDRFEEKLAQRVYVCTYICAYNTALQSVGIGKKKANPNDFEAHDSARTI